MKRVLITGASSGIGKATANLFLARGYTVIATARRVDRMDDLVKQGAIAISMDITDESSIHAAMIQIKEQFGGIDILVNNAGYGSMGSLEEVSIDEARRQFEVNLFGLGRITQLVIPAMRAQKFGRIINIGSMGGVMTTPFGGWYHATKFALEGYSDILRFETKPLGIDVILIQPGAINSEWEGIADRSMKETSGAGPYGSEVEKCSNMFKATYRFGSSPELVGKAIVKAATTRKPRTRYAVGFGSKQFIFLRRVLSDRMYDAMLRLVMSLAR